MSGELPGSPAGSGRQIMINSLARIRHPSAVGVRLMYRRGTVILSREPRPEAPGDLSICALDLSSEECLTTWERSTTIGPRWVNRHGGRHPWVLVEIWPNHQNNLSSFASALPADQPMVAFSPPSPGAVSRMWRIEHFSSYYARWIRALGTTAPVHLVGWSASGAVVAEIASQMPERIGSAVLVDTWMMRSLRPLATLRRARTTIEARAEAGLLEAAAGFVRREREMQRRLWDRRKAWLRGIAIGPPPMTAEELTLRAVSFAGMFYTPRPVQVPTSFISAAGTERRQGIDCFVHWRPYLRHLVEHRVVEADHYSLWQRPFLDEMIETLRLTAAAAECPLPSRRQPRAGQYAPLLPRTLAGVCQSIRRSHQRDHEAT